jgi:dipeptidyl aminopeptidase/acylaminoacyl peptidase
MLRPGALASLACSIVLVLGGCSGATEPDEPRSEQAPTAEPTESTEPSASPGPSESPPQRDRSRDRTAEPRLPPVRTRPSLPALMREDLRAGRIRRTEQLGSTDRWTGWAVTYTVDGATVSGELLVPTGKGPFPALVLNHGHIEPSIYILGQGMSREQEWLASNGFVVLHTDYRGHAGSDPVGDLDRETRMAYTRDAIGAVGALRKEEYVDPDRLGMVGRSMGGGVTYNALVTRPDLVDAAVVFAPVSSDIVDNLRMWTIPERPDEAQALFARLGGSPQDNPRAYRELSARTFFDRVEAPVLIHHGTADDTCPLPWSRETHRLLTRAGVESRLELYAGEGHAFGPQFPRSMEATVEFLRRHLR